MVAVKICHGLFLHPWNNAALNTRHPKRNQVSEVMEPMSMSTVRGIQVDLGRFI